MTDIFQSLKKYNFWDGNIPNLGFKRTEYVNNLLQYTNNKLIKIITGQRRVGKSYIMRQLISELISSGVKATQILYFNKEIFDFQPVKTDVDFKQILNYFETEIALKSKKYILVDEVQEIIGWEKIVSSLSQDYNTEYELFITGSNSHLLSGELATLLSGRYVQFEVMPFSYYEFCQINTINVSRSTYIEYLKTGGLPELFHLPTNELKLHYLASLKDSIVLKDIVQRYKIKDIALLENLFKYIIDNIGNLFSTNSLTKYLKSQKINTNNETLGAYIHYLANTFLIHNVERFDIKGKAILTGLQKIYLNDLSFRNLMSSFNTGWGQSLENAVYLYCKQKGYKIYIGGINGNEIDFIISKNNNTIYLQVAQQLLSPETIEREFGNLEAITDHYRKYVVTLDEFSLGNRNGIEHILAWELNNYF